MELTEFARARLDEDEAAAEAAKHSPILGAIQAGRRNGKASAHAHVTRHDPVRVLVQVAAMRAIVGLHSPGDDGRCTTCIEHCGDNIYPTEYAKAPCLETRHLAAIWASHPDYDPAWSPEGE